MYYMRDTVKRAARAGRQKKPPILRDWIERLSPTYAGQKQSKKE
jgi:hypothetical protein